MKTRKSILVIAAALISMTALAQNPTDFFLRNYSYRYRLNPAFQSEKAFLGVGAGAVNVTFDTNMGISSFLFPGENGMVTGFNPSVSADDFMAKLQDLNNLNLSMNESIIALGSWSKSGFTTFEANIKAYGSASLPKEFMKFLKVGGVDQTYDMSGLNLNGKVYAEVAFGHSRAIGDNLVVGARVKALVGLAQMDVTLSKFDLYTGHDEWRAEMEGDLKGSFPFFVPRTDAEGNLIINQRPPITLEKLKPAGLGAAVDFGATYSLGFITLSAAVQDLGLISWKNNFLGKAQSSTTYKGADNIDMNNGGGSQIGDSVEDALKQLVDMAKFKAEEASRSSEMLPIGVNLGADANFGIAHVGAFLSTKKNAVEMLWDGRLGASITPIKWFCLSANAGVNNYGKLAGGAISINAASVNFYLSTEINLNKVTPKYYIPLDPVRLSLMTGLNITFGRRRDVK